MLSVVLALSWTGNVQAQEVTRTATHYGYEYNNPGHGLGCTGVQYNSENTTIVALSYTDKVMWPCGTQLLIEGPAGTNIVTVQDTCGGCGPLNMIDFSESAIIAVCGGLGSCQVNVSEVIY